MHIFCRCNILLITIGVCVCEHILGGVREIWLLFWFTAIYLINLWNFYCILHKTLSRHYIVLVSDQISETCESCNRERVPRPLLCYTFSHYSFHPHSYTLSHNSSIICIDIYTPLDSTKMSYYSGLMNIRRKTLICDLKVSGITIQPGNMQATTGIKEARDFLRKSFIAKASGEVLVNVY